MAHWPCRACMGSWYISSIYMQEISDILPRPHKSFVYWSFIEVFIKKDAFIARIGSFEQISSCQIWNLAMKIILVGLLPKVTKSGNFYLRQNWQFLSSAIVLQLLAAWVTDIFPAFVYWVLFVYWILSSTKVAKTKSFQIWHFFYHNKWCSKSGRYCILTHKVLFVGAEVDQF